MLRTAIIHNPNSGSNATSVSSIRKVFGKHAKELVFLNIKDGVEQLAQQAKRHGIQLLVAAGGDGTVNATASLAVKLSLPLGIIPVGTLNHFAKDLGLPLDLETAVEVILDQHLEAVDYCTVNDQVFVNNSSIGLYPATVLRREALQPKLGKWLAATVATLHVGFRLRSTHLTFKLAGVQHIYKTPLAFIGNNSYQFDKFGFTNRERLDESKLFIYIVRANRLTAILRLLVQAFFGRRWKGHDYLKITESNLIIDSPKPTLKVAIDGEVLTMQPPLTYQSHPKGLRICTARSNS
jgi:diacylglycerol kinase family enzyme